MHTNMTHPGHPREAAPCFNGNLVARLSRPDS
jgi:hypothetical protein